MRNWSRRIWLGLGLAAVLVGAVVAWAFASGGRGGLWLEMQFLGYTNPANYSRGLALFAISNRTDRTVEFDALPEFQRGGQWPKPSGPFRLSGAYVLEPHESLVFRMLYPEDGRPFRAVVGYAHPQTPWEKRRAQWAFWLTRHKFTAPARWISPRSELREIRSEERRWPGKLDP